MISIQTNVNSLIAQQNLSVNSAFQSKTIAQLTSGYRINQSGDDAAGLAVANKFRSTVAELTQGVSNGNDATAQLQIMDGGMSNISSILDRLKTLATQSASGTFTGSRTTLNSEFQSDLQEIDRQSQSIGLNTGGVFAKNLSVYLGVGSGSQSMQNGLVSLDLTQSAVDSQSLGMRGMEVVNLTSGSLAGTNAGVDIGSTSTTSVENIVNNTTGVNANQQATAGYAALEFSGSGFSDAGKIGMSVNLAGVTDVATLVTAVNSAIQAAGNGTTAAATAFKSANIVASVHTDSGGGQQLAFSSSTSAFQVQAGDQMANALLGNVSVVGGVAKGAAISGTSATNVAGAATTAGFLTQGQTVKLVVIGGGLASPVTLQVNTAGGTAVTTSGAITDLENQFSGSAVLQAAGLSMTGSSTPGSQLTFTSASGQAFNIEMTGDTSNLLGLGSFSTDAAGNADYTEITAGTAYSAATVTGSATTTGLAAGLEISLNGQQATALTAIDLTAGANAVAASATSSASIGAGTADISATNNNLDITVTNNGVATHKIFSLTTNQLATNGTVASTIAGLTNGASFTGYAATALAHNDTFTVSVDGGAAQNVTVDGTFAAGATGAGLFMTALQAALPAGVTAGWDATTNELTFTSGTTGAHSSVALGAATYASSASAWMTTTSANIVTTPVIVANASNNNKFNLAVDGGASVTLTVADGTYNTAAGFLSAINNAISGAGLAASVTAGWDPISNEMTLTTVSTGAASSLAVSAVAGNTGLTNIGYMASTNHGSATAANTGLTHFALNANTTAVAGQNDAPTTVQSIATQIATQLGASAAVTVSNDNKISIASTTKGANSLVTINTPGTNSANGTLHLTTPTPVAGLNSSIGDIVNNLNAQFAANSTYQNAGLKAVATLSDGTGSGSFLTIQSNNGTQFRLNAVGAPAAATAGAYASTVTQSSIAVSTPLAVTLNTNDKFNIAVDGGSATQVQVAASSYTTAGAFLIAVNAAITGSALTGLVTAGWDATTGALTLTSATTGGNSSVAVSAVGGNTGMTHLGFSAGTNSGHQVEVTENTGYGVAGASFTAATPGSSGTAMSTLNAYGISNSGAFTFSALQYGSDKQALTFSATDANGTLETETITLQNNASVNRAGASIDDAVAYLNQQLQQTTANPALQKIVAVKQANAGGTAEAINFVSSLSNFTVGVAATANGDGLNSGLATYRTSAANGSGANMSIDTAAGAMAAITAIAAAIDKLGAAQATIGKGENQLTYAVNLAQSQITNFSAAESQIRDANVAQQAANLSKAQVLTQASIAAMAQANSAPQAVLTLLRG